MCIKSGGEGEAAVNTLETWTDRNLKVPQRQIHSVASWTEKPRAAGQTAGRLARKLCWKTSSCSSKRNMSQQLILAGGRLTLHCSAWRRKKGDLIGVFNCLKERCEEDKTRLFLQVRSGRTRGNTCKLQKEKLQLDTAKNCTGCPERSKHPHPLRHSKLNYTRPWITCSTLVLL